MFEVVEYHNENIQCYQVNVIKEMIEFMSRREVSTSSIEKVIVHSIKTIGQEENRDITEFILQLQETQIEKSNKKFEELRGNNEVKRSTIFEFK